MMSLERRKIYSKIIKHGMTYKETLMTNTVMEEYEEDITNRVENMALKFKDNLIKKAELEVDYIDLIISETELMKEINEKHECSLNCVNESIKIKKDVGEYLGRCKLYVENFISKNDKTGLKKLQQEEEELFQRVSGIDDEMDIIREEETRIVDLINESRSLKKVLCDEWRSIYGDDSNGKSIQFVVLGDKALEYEKREIEVQELCSKQQQRMSDIPEKFRRVEKIIEYNLKKINDLLIEKIQPVEGLRGNNMQEIGKLTHRVTTLKNQQFSAKCFYV